MRKIYRLGIMMLMMLAAALPAARAYNFVSDGIYYDITGGSPNTVAVTYATGSYNSYSGNVDIPSTVTYNGTHYTVTAIGNNAFRNCSNLTGVTIPGTVTSIGEYAFYGCSGLTSVTIPGTVTSIGESAFYGCSGLTSVTIPNGVETIGAEAFSHCGGLAVVTIGKSVTSIGNYAFTYCSALTTVFFNADSCINMGSTAMSPFVAHSYGGGTGFKLVIGNNVKNIPDNAFARCYNLDTLNIPPSVSRIGKWAFYFSGITNLHLSEGLAEIDHLAFCGCGMSSVNIPSTVSSIAPGAFATCPNISVLTVSNNNQTYDSRNNCKAIVESNTNTLVVGCKNSIIPSNVTAIGKWAFSGCSGLTGAITIHDQIKNIGDMAFERCTGIVSLTIGKSVDSIGNSAFYQCSALSSVTFNPDSCIYMGSGEYIDDYGNGYVFANSGLSSLTIGDNVKIIPSNAFTGCSTLGGLLNLPNSVKIIGDNAFSGCSALTGNLVLPDSIFHIGDAAFYDCSGLTGTLTIHRKVKYIGKNAFNKSTSVIFNADSCATIGSISSYNNSYSSAFGNLTSLQIGDNVKYIPPYTFSNETGLTGTLIIPDSVITIGERAFNGCIGLDTIVFGESLTTIGERAFNGCIGLDTIVFGESLTTIKQYTFYGCTGLTGVSFPNVDTVEAYAFYGCSGLQSLDLDGVKYIGGSAFRNCDGLTHLDIPNTVTTIAGDAFSSCTNLKAVFFNADSCVTMNTVFRYCDSLSTLIFGDNVKNIPDYAFYGCNKLAGPLTLPDSLVNIGNYSFYNCSSLTGELVIPDAVKTMGGRAFQNCSDIESVVIGKSVTSIKEYTFLGCVGLDTLTIGRGVQSIGGNAFQNCTGLSTVIFNADSCIKMGSWDNYYSYQRFSAFNGCNNFSSLTIGNHVKNIPYRAFYNLNSLDGSVMIPDSVLTISSEAFMSCSNIDTLIIGRSVRTTGNDAFKNCTGLTHVTFNADNCLTMGENNSNRSLIGCTNVSSLSIGDNVKTIPPYAFYGLNQISGDLVIPDSVVKIGQSAFSGCSGYTSLLLGQSVDSIGGGAFSNCNKLFGTLVIPNSVRIIGSVAFMNCSFDSLVIGKHVSSLGTRCFTYCSHLKYVTFNADSCLFIGSYVDIPFLGCDSIVTLTIGNNVKHIPDHLFRGCNKITGTLIIPDSVKSIGTYAFYQCSNITGLILGRSLNDMGTAFVQCSGFQFIRSYAVNAPTIDMDYRPFSSTDRNIPVYVPCGSTQSYQSTWRGWDMNPLNSYSYFYNIYETLQPYLLTAIPADTLQGTVHVTTQPTCTEPAVIEATPNFFYVFDHWSDGNTDNPRTIELTQDTTLVAHFREYALNIIQPSDSTYGQVIVLQQPTADNPQAVVEMIADTSCYNFYSWITPANDWESIGNENPITITLTQDTTIRATVTSRLSMNVSLLPQWTDFVCEGDTMILTASGAESYMWTNRHWDSAEGRYVDDDTLGFNADLHLTEVGSYRLRVTGTDSSGCKGWYNIQQVHVFPNPDFTISGSTEFCAGDSTSLSIEFAPPATITLLSEDFSNGLSEDWTIANHYLEISTIESSTHGNAVLFPCYDLSSNETDELLLPEMDLSGRPTAILKFDVAYRQYNYENDQLKLLYSTDNGATWYTLYSKSGSNLATLGYSSNYFTPNDLQWRTDSIILTETWNYTNVFIKFVFTSRYGNNLWIDNIRILSSDAPINGDYMQYTWNNGATSQQQTIESTGVYRVTVSDYACSTTDSVTVTVWQPDTTELTVTAEHSPYTLNGETFCTSGDYTQTLQTVHGCDSVVNLHLTIMPDTMVIYDTLCVGERAFGQSIMSPEEYQQTLAMLESQFGDSIPYELTYDTNTHIVSVKALTVYISEYWQSGVEEDYGGWLNPTYDYYDTTIYLNYNAWKDSSYYNFTYTLTYPSSLGCDSTVTKHLTAKFSDASYWLVTACGSYVWNGDTIVSSGEYYHSFTNVNGCDSTETLYLTVLPSVSEELSATACDSYTWNGVTYTESGDYTFNSDTIVVTQRDAELCDSWNNGDYRGECWCISQNSDWNAWECFYINTVTGDTLVYDDNTDSYVPGTPVFPVVYDTVPACKTTTLHLTITPSVAELVEATACDSYTWNDSTYTASGDYTQTFTAANGCDSVVTLHLTVNSSVAEIVEATACDSYTWNGSTYTASGDYTQTFETANGCDSVVTLHLTILPSPTPAITGVTTVCEGQTATLIATGGMSYLWEDGTTTTSFSATESGVYTVTVTNANGCSATASATVTVNPLPEVAVTGNTYICPGGSTVLTATGAATYMWSNGSTNAAIPVNAFGQYSVIGTSAEGCFSTASVTVLVSQPPVITINGNTNLCAGESTTLTATGGVSYMWSNGSTDSAITVNSAGNWQVIGYNENNCSNMASVTVNVWQPAATDLYITSFDSCYMWFGTPRCESGDYTHTLQTIHGCDSVITLHLTLEDAIVTEFSATACDSYMWNGATYSQSGNYTQSFTAVNGNDSIVTLHLTINTSKQMAFADSTCTAYVWNGQTYAVSGDYIQTFTAVNGCDSVVTLHLTVNHSTAGDTTAVACESFSWHGNTYTQSGTYTHTMTNAVGCDSVVTLHLTVNQTVAVTDTRTVCASELPIVWNGVQFAGAGTQTATLQTANGCDSVVTMTLTVNHPTAGDTTAVACESFSWHGNTYTQSGNYTYTTTNVAGCDSVVTLHLTVMADFVPQVTVSGALTACGNGTATLSLTGTYHDYLWSTGDTTATITVGSAGYYWVTIGDGNGCTSVSEPVHLGVSELVSETPALCMVGVEDQHNLVVWEPLADSDVAEYRLYRENGQANIFEPLAVIPAGSGNAYADTTADPSVRAWRYKITAADTCGGETPMSALHKTVHLTINQGLANSYNLIWTPYEGFEFASYRLYRGTANNNLQLIQTMPSTLTSFTDQNPDGDALFYQIEVVMDGSCVQETRDITFTGARSNIVYNGVPVATDVAVEACESYDWNGEVLTSSGEYTHSFNSVLGYDSVVTLHLTIHQPAASEFTVSCPDSCYTWNGTEYCASGDYTQTLQTVHGCDSVVTLHLTITVGIDEHDLAGSVKVFPNPANDFVNVQCTMYNVQLGADLHVFDVYGKLVQTVPMAGETTILNISTLADGMYFVRVTTEDGMVTKPFVVKR